MPKPTTAREILLNAAIGQRLRDARLSMTPKMSSTTLGTHLNLSYQQILKYETGTNAITAARLILAADALNLPPSFLLMGFED